MICSLDSDQKGNYLMPYSLLGNCRRSTILTPIKHCESNQYAESWLIFFLVVSICMYVCMYIINDVCFVSFSYHVIFYCKHVRLSYD